MTYDSEAFASSVIEKLPRVGSLLKDITQVDFHQENLRLGSLVEYMFRETSKTNGSLNRVIVYAQVNCVGKTVETWRGFMLLFNKGLLSPAYSLTRTIFELWAAACFVEDAIRDFLVSRDEIGFSKIANKLFSGTRYPVRLPWGEPSQERPIPISEMLMSLEKRLPERAREYGFLCEYCHPNLLYNMYSYLASHETHLWNNPLFLKNMSETMERQLSLLSEALQGIKQCATAIYDMCSKEYLVGSSM